ncbi:MAG: hypothetical protein LAO30_19760 [Acidobacteriia bacterium]|nr:hypothetical protein [Terriglobia bacterium]
MKILLAVCLFLLTAPLWARSHNHPVKLADASDPGYVFALAAANRFLHAWQTADLESGTVLLSDGIRHSQNADKLEDFFSSGKDRGFEIARGHGHSGRYSFPVVLVTSRGSKITRRSSEIILLETGKNDWVVDKLP